MKPESIIKILVADDEPKICASVKKYLEFMDYQVDVAHNGEEALRKAKEFKPSYVLLDIRMPVLSGYEVLKVLKTELPNSIFIMTTAVASEDLGNECIKRGAYGYLTKPIHFDDLGTTILKALNSEQAI